MILQELLAQEKTQASSSNNDEVDLDELMDDPELEKLHADRIAALKKEAEKREALKRKDTESTGRITDKHLKALAPKHMETKFIKLDAETHVIFVCNMENAPFFVAKLESKRCLVSYFSGLTCQHIQSWRSPLCFSHFFNNKKSQCRKPLFIFKTKPSKFLPCAMHSRCTSIAKPPNLGGLAQQSPPPELVGGLHQASL
ncbi:hypothetical protein SLEP1_g49082 [Rubroshorea leprosula]|uniref:Uncharacterized protein n=1 Tax=Rubroshorea leprosula TaxID=152421 RepID=A0AAV5LY40_9ROSI|nr:hypothetical protein SLEP1_g49082 [Rubroshorea leprosula]